MNPGFHRGNLEHTKEKLSNPHPPSLPIPNKIALAKSLVVTLPQEQSYTSPIKAITDTLKWLVITVARIRAKLMQTYLTPPPRKRKSCMKA